MTLAIRRVDGRRGTARFIDAAWQVHEAHVRSGSPTRWVPPLRRVVANTLSRENPFYEEADRELFVAERDGHLVGRIAAIENRRHNRHHGDRVGFFGFFETVDDPDVSTALLREAEGWLRERSLATARGPISPSMNHESGLLVEGFETAPAIMTPWNPPHYSRLMEAAGYSGVQDLLGYDIEAGSTLAVPDRVRALAERAARKTSVTFRTLDVDVLEQEARNVLELYCQAWAGNWGFTPPSWDEFWHTARDLKSVLVDDFSFVAEVNGEVIGFMMVARDINRVLRHVPSGRLWPKTLVRLARDLPRVQRGRIVLMGLRAEYRRRGLFPLFAYEAARRAKEIGAEGAEASWILSDNTALTAPMSAMGMHPYKRWRIYETAL
ncbi:MAG: N-acetyltransferase [Longimicrobiales bacterium]